MLCPFLSFFCTVTLGGFEPRLFFIEVLCSLSVPALLLISLPVSLHGSLTCVPLSLPPEPANIVRALI